LKGTGINMKIRTNVNSILAVILALLIMCAFLSSCSISVFNQSINFADKEFERLIRDYINKPEGEIIQSDLDKITEIHINGSLILHDNEDIGDFRRISDDLNIGGIKTLEDLTYFNNLT
jgi:hypothetical protein